MKYDDVKKYENMIVKLILKNGFRYSGTITKVNEDSIILNDKYKQDVLIDISDLSVVMEFGGNSDGY